MNASGEKLEQLEQRKMNKRKKYLRSRLRLNKFAFIENDNRRNKFEKQIAFRVDPRIKLKYWINNSVRRT